MFSKIIVSMLILFQINTMLVDKIAAVVDESIITLTDIDMAIQLYPVFRKAGESENTFYSRVLAELIDNKVVYLEYQGEFNLLEEDYEEVQTPIIRKMGDLDQLMSLLKRFDMEWDDYKDFIKERVVYEKVLKEKFQLKITIPFAEIETFYNEEYRPLQKSLELNPRTLIEMSPLIEEHLRGIRTGEKLSGWLREVKATHRIENKMLEESE